MRLWDSHVHLDVMSTAAARPPHQPSARPAGGADARIAPAGQEYAAMVPGLDPDGVDAALARDDLPAGCRFAAAVHPWRVAGEPEADPRWAAVCRLAEHRRVSAVGETGVDHYRHRTQEERDMAAAWFLAHLRLAARVDLPVVVHCVRAHGECLDLITRAPPPRGGVIHAFSGSLETAEAYRRAGFLVGIGAAVTRPTSKRVRRAAAEVPDEQLLVETDAPYLAVDDRGRDEGTAADIVRVVEVVAALRDTSPEAVAELTWRNAERLFAGR